MIVAVALTLHNKLRSVPWNELNRMRGLDILTIGFAIDFGNLVSGCCVVGYESAIVLIAVELEDIDGLLVWTPCNIGKVAVGRVAGFQIDNLLGFHVINAHSNLMRRFTCHGIFSRSSLSYARFAFRWHPIYFGNIY